MISFKYDSNWQSGVDNPDTGNIGNKAPNEDKQNTKTITTKHTTQHQVERKSGYITNRIYTLGTRDKHEMLTGCV
jgi:hypothetical protein